MITTKLSFVGLPQGSSIKGFVGKIGIAFMATALSDPKMTLKHQKYQESHRYVKI